MKAIWMQTTKRGTRAYYWSNLAMRAMPLKMAEAEAMILNGTARLYDENPMSLRPR